MDFFLLVCVDYKRRLLQLLILQWILHMLLTQQSVNCGAHQLRLGSCVKERSPERGRA